MNFGSGNHVLTLCTEKFVGVFRVFQNSSSQPVARGQIIVRDTDVCCPRGHLKYEMSFNPFPGKAGKEMPMQF